MTSPDGGSALDSGPQASGAHQQAEPAPTNSPALVRWFTSIFDADFWKETIQSTAKWLVLTIGVVIANGGNLRLWWLGVLLGTVAGILGVSYLYHKNGGPTGTMKPGLLVVVGVITMLIMVALALILALAVLTLLP